jgi:hypothetical protein
MLPCSNSVVCSNVKVVPSSQVTVKKFTGLSLGCRIGWGVNSYLNLGGQVVIMSQ